MRNKINQMYWNMVTKSLCAKNALIERAMEKTEGASHFVEILVAIVVVIAIAGVFKNQIVNFVNNITGTATTKASGLF